MGPDSGGGGAAPAAARIRVDYWTDPLCCWSWAFEPVWRRLRTELAGQIDWRHRMGGMIPSWAEFDDPLNDVGSPARMGPHWLYVRQCSGMPLDERIWAEDPPGSSYPASLAFKAAERQGAPAAEQYLRRVREAVMLERRNVARREVLLELAIELARDSGGVFDATRFEHDLGNEVVLDAFRDDVKEARYQRIGRFPALVLTPAEGAGLLLVGYRPYAALLEALRRLAPALQPVPPPTSAAEYLRLWGSATAPEVGEALGAAPEDAERELEALARRSLLTRHGSPGRSVYRVARAVPAAAPARAHQP